MEKVVIGLSVLIILGAPLLTFTDFSFAFVGNIATRLLIVMGVLYSITKGVVPGLLAFLAACTLLIERNHEMLTGLPYQIESIPLTQPVAIVPTRVIPPENKSVVFDSPGRIEKADASDLHDNNPRLKEVPENSAAPGFFSSKGLA
jgi:hypothetical protein